MAGKRPDMQIGSVALVADKPIRRVLQVQTRPSRRPGRPWPGQTRRQCWRCGSPRQPRRCGGTENSGRRGHPRAHSLRRGAGPPRPGAWRSAWPPTMPSASMAAAEDQPSAQFTLVSRNRMRARDPATTRGQRLTVAQALQPGPGDIRGEADGRGQDGPGKGAPPHLIHAGHGVVSMAPECVLRARRWAGRPGGAAGDGRGCAWPLLNCPAANVSERA